MFSLTSVLLGMLLLGMWIVASCTARAACTTMRLNNKPGLTGAMMLTLLAVAGAVAAQFGVGVMMGMSSALGASPEGAANMKLMLVMPVWMIVCAMVYRFMLPTTFGKAMCMFAAQVVIVGAMMVGFNMLANMTGQSNLMEVRQMMPL